MLVALLLGAIVLGTVEMGRQLVATALEPPYLLIEPAALFHSFGQFLIILIGLELLKVLKLHLQHQKLPPQVVLEVAVIAVCNKVLTVDAHELDGLSIIGIAALVLALTAGYWLFVRARGKDA